MGIFTNNAYHIFFKYGLQMLSISDQNTYI